jgi:hypothetical protein
MEVHHHPSTSSGHNRKKWTHYLREFLMLFFAVFCGFLAEYTLEHKIEADREKQYAFSMVEDLKLDTAALNKVILLRTKRLQLIDSFFLLMNGPVDTTRLSDLYFYSLLIRRFAMLHFIYNDGTIQQLKTGGLRLIRTRIVADSIVQYDSYVRRIEKAQEREEISIQDFKPYCLKIFDGRIYYEMITENDRPRRPFGNPALLRYTKEDLNNLIATLTSVKSSNVACRSFSAQLYNKAAGLLYTIKKEYHMK